jgi:glycosyltransferase involved in cell wall biosynthesis
MSRTVLIVAYSLPPIARVGGMRIARFMRYLPESGWRVAAISPTVEAAVGDRVDLTLNKLLPDDAVIRRAALWGPFRWLLQKLSREESSGAHDAKLPPDTGDAPAAAKPTGSRFRRLARKPARLIKDLLSLPLTAPDKRVTWSLAAYRAARRTAREVQADAVLTSGPPHSSHLVGLALQRKTGIAWVSDFRDPWARSSEHAHDQRPLRHRINKTLERWCVEHSDRVILNTPAACAEFAACYPTLPREKFVAIPNGYDPEVRVRVEALKGDRPAKRDGEPICLCHAGSVYGRRDIRPLIDALALLNRDGLRFVFEQVGSLNRADEVAAHVAKTGAERFVHLLGQQPHEEALRRMAAADILVVVRQNTALQVPAKLYEMMLFGQPILALDGEGAMAQIVRDYQIGVVADPVDPALIARGVESAAAQLAGPDHESRPRALAQFDARSQTAELAKVLAAAVESKRRRPR